MIITAPPVTIVLFNGGFVGDLICALHNPLLFEGFWHGRCMLTPRVWQLKDHEWCRQHSTQDKIRYLHSVTDAGVCGSHDLKFSLQLRDHTVLMTCSDWPQFQRWFNRWDRTRYPDADCSVTDLWAWQDMTQTFFARQIDTAFIWDDDFLDRYDLVTPQAQEILEGWRSLHGTP